MMSMISYIADNLVIGVISVSIVIDLFESWIRRRRIGIITYALLRIVAKVFGIDEMLGQRVGNNNRNFFYSIDEKRIIYRSSTDWFEMEKIAIDADVPSFIVLDDFYWARDRSFIYYRHCRLDYLEADLDTFRVCNYNWAIDKECVYLAVSEQLPVIRVEGADPGSFKYLDDNWSRDRAYCFYRGRKSCIDIGTARQLNVHFVADKDAFYVVSTARLVDGVYQFDKVVAALEDIVVIDAYHIRDKSNIYTYCSYRKGIEYGRFITIPFKSIDDICFMNEDVILVDDKVYYEAHLVEGADAMSFVELEHGYYRDKNHLFYEDVIVDGVDFDTFIYNEERFCYEDKNWNYCQGRKEEMMK